jgi:hypothetical protein
MKMSIKVSDSEDAVRILAYFITRTCGDMFDKMFKDLEMHKKERHYEQDYNDTTFMWSVYGEKNPRRIIMVKVDDSFGDNRILVDPVFFYDPNMFSLRKPVCFNINFDEKDRRFKFEIFGGEWGPKLDKVDLDPFNDPYELVRFDELIELYKELKTIVGKVNINLEFVEKVEVEDESTEEETPNENH